MRFVTGAAVWPGVSKEAGSRKAARPAPAPSRKGEGELVTLQHVDQLAHIREMQAGGGLVEDVEGVAGGSPAEFLGELTRCASPPERVVPCWPTLA